MSSMMPQGEQMPPQVQALLAQMAQGGQGGPQGPPPPDQAGVPASGADWLVDAINSVHAGMVQEGDPKQVSLLGAILNQLTTFQANRANSGGGQGPAGG